MSGGDKTFRNLLDYEVAEHGKPQVHDWFHRTHRYYSAAALRSVSRSAVSPTATCSEISYENDDPGWFWLTRWNCSTTEFVEQYKEPRFKETNDANPVLRTGAAARCGANCASRRDSLRDYSTKNLNHQLRRADNTRYPFRCATRAAPRHWRRLNLNSSELLRRKTRHSSRRTRRSSATMPIPSNNCTRSAISARDHTAAAGGSFLPTAANPSGSLSTSRKRWCRSRTARPTACAQPHLGHRQPAVHQRGYRHGSLSSNGSDAVLLDQVGTKQGENEKSRSDDRYVQYAWFTDTKRKNCPWISFTEQSYSAML